MCLFVFAMCTCVHAFRRACMCFDTCVFSFLFPFCKMSSPLRCYFGLDDLIRLLELHLPTASESREFILIEACNHREHHAEMFKKQMGHYVCVVAEHDLFVLHMHRSAVGIFFKTSTV